MCESVSRAGPIPTGELPIEQRGKPCIWMTWPGHDKIPGYLELCRDSVHKHNADDFEVMLITPDNLSDTIQDIHPAYPYLSYVHRADYIRCEVLHQRGGLYLDMDTLCFRSLRSWYEMIHYYDIVSYDGTPWGEVFGISVFGPIRRNSVLTRSWSTRMRDHLNRRMPDLVKFRKETPDPTRDGLAWNEILGQIMLPLAHELKDQGTLSFHKIGLEHFSAAGQLFGVDRLFERGRLAVSASTDLLILNNALYPIAFKQLSKGDVLSLDTGLTHLIGQALEGV